MTNLLREGAYWLLSFTRWSGSRQHVTLPQSVLEKIANYIDDPVTLLNFALTCHRFANIVRKFPNQSIIMRVVRIEEYWDPTLECASSHPPLSCLQQRGWIEPEFEPISPGTHWRARRPGTNVSQFDLVENKKWLTTSLRQLNSNWPLVQLTYLK